MIVSGMFRIEETTGDPREMVEAVGYEIRPATGPKQKSRPTPHGVTLVCMARGKKAGPTEELWRSEGGIVWITGRLVSRPGDERFVVQILTLARAPKEENNE